MQTQTRKTIIVLQGPTAAGKTGAALELARLFSIEIINADAMQVYRGMDIGTSKPDAAQQALVPHHLFSVVEPDEDFSAADYVRRCRAAIEDISARGRIPLIVGGTGLYVRALLHGLSEAPGENPVLRRLLRQLSTEDLCARLAAVDPESAARIHRRDSVRLVRALEVFMSTGVPLSAHHAAHRFEPAPYNAVRICLSLERQELYRRIDDRVVQMFADGFVEEVQGLLDRGIAATAKPMQAIGYRHVIDYLHGACSRDESLRCIKRDTRHLAKRQLTWLKRIPELCWVDSAHEHDRIALCVKKALNNS